MTEEFDGAGIGMGPTNLPLAATSLVGAVLAIQRSGRRQDGHELCAPGKCRAMTPTMGPDLLDALRERLGARAVVTGSAIHDRRYTDWSEAPSVPPLAIVLPATPDDVATTLEICSRFGQKVSIQGGLTGLAGGANPQDGEIALSLERLNGIEDFDEVGGTVIAQAGVTLQALQEAVEARGWNFPVDLGARGSAQIGGNAATNAGGNRVLRYGMMRQSVLGLEVALPDGTLLTMLDRVLKNNSGFDLKQMFIGAEGALGVITRLSLKLVPLAPASSTLLCALPDFAAATRLLRMARQGLPGLSSFELMWASYFDAALAATRQVSPFAAAHPLYVLLETLGADEDAAAGGLENLLEGALADSTVTDAVLAQSLGQARALWNIREGIAELLTTTKPNIAFDVSIPLPLMDDFVTQMTAELGTRHPDVQHLFFGHLGDDNLHLLSGPYADEAQMLRVEEDVYAAVGRAGGSISAEHGIGFVKRPFLHHSRSAEEIKLMRGIKQLIDPCGILNAGRIIELGETA